MVESFSGFVHPRPPFVPHQTDPLPDIKGKYIVLESGNELANRLRGVLSGFFLGVLTDRVFIADITYQKDVRQGLLSALFEGPGYQASTIFTGGRRGRDGI